jgi:hypothetical protein
MSEAGCQIYVFCALPKKSHSDILSNRDNLRKAVCEPDTLSVRLLDVEDNKLRRFLLKFLQYTDFPAYVLKGGGKG